jgi:hypothetical protein
MEILLAQEALMQVRAAECITLSGDVPCFFKLFFKLGRDMSFAATAVAIWSLCASDSDN